MVRSNILLEAAARTRVGYQPSDISGVVGDLMPATAQNSNYFDVQVEELGQPSGHTPLFMLHHLPGHNTTRLGPTRIATDAVELIVDDCPLESIQGVILIPSHTVYEDKEVSQSRMTAYIQERS